VKCRSGTFQVRVMCAAAVRAESSTTELERAHARRRAASIMMRSRLGPIPVQCGVAHSRPFQVGIGVVQAATVAAAPSESTGTAWGIHGGIGFPSQPLAHWQRHERPLETPAALGAPIWYHDGPSVVTRTVPCDFKLASSSRTPGRRSCSNNTETATSVPHDDYDDAHRSHTPRHRDGFAKVCLNRVMAIRHLGSARIHGHTTILYYHHSSNANKVRFLRLADPGAPDATPFIRHRSSRS
jgi:hypothetical protein